MPSQDNRRVLVVDDNPSIHEDFRKILTRASMDVDDELAALEAALFGEVDAPSSPQLSFELTSAYQGLEAIDAVAVARRDGIPFTVAFLDVRMPPGIDGIETATRLLEKDPELQIVICTAYSD
ncbi:MAG: response regulator, partial [Polyangiaceae bacterium]